MEIHSTQGKAQVKVQTKNRANPLDLEQMKMNEIPLTIHVLAAISRPTNQGKWKKAQETDKLIASEVQYIVLVYIVYTYCYKFIERLFAK